MLNTKLIARPFNWSIAFGVMCILIALGFLSVQHDLTLVSLTSLLLGPLLGAGLLLLILGVVFRYESEQTSTRFSMEISGALSESLKSFLHRVDLSRLANECEKIGLVGIEADCSNYDYSKILSESQQLVIILNDGRTWASVHRDRLRRRFSDPTKQTTFILCHPNSPMLQVLARKGSIEVPDLKSRIMQTVKLLDEIKQPTTQLEVLGHYLFNSYSLILGDDTAIIIPYFISRGGRTAPMFKYEETKDNSYFNYIVEDIERLRMDTENISCHSKNNDMSEGIIRFHRR